MKIHNNIYKKIGALFLSVAIILASIPMQTPAATKSTALQSIVKSYKKNSSRFTLTSGSRFFIVSDTSQITTVNNSLEPYTELLDTNVNDSLEPDTELLDTNVNDTLEPDTKLLDTDINDSLEPSTELLNTVNLVRSEFAEQNYPSSAKLSVAWGGEADSLAGDIVIRMTTGMKSEAYRLSIREKAIITASDYDGIFYGLRTLLQLFMSEASNTLQGCTIKDTPSVKERTVHLDCARKYYSRKWIETLIKDMSHMKYNALELHFSEDQALRLESKQFPWLAGATEGSQKYLTRKDMARICKTARKYHIEIIPSFDSPGHMDYIVKTYANYVKDNPDFKFEYNGKTYSKKSKGFSNISNFFQYKGDKSDYNYRGIDITNPTALAFTNALIDEYADFFAAQGCTKFNIGGDELLGWSEITVGGKTFNFNTKWNALEHWKNYARKTLKINKGSSSDTFINYLNTLASRLEKKNYSVRVWSDEINRNKDQHISLKKSISIVYWSNDFASINKLKKKGYSFYNAVSEWCYYVVRKDSLGIDLMKTTYKNVNGKYIYKNWNPKSFASPGNKKKTVSAKQYAGAYFCIWGDMPTYKSASKIRKETRSRMWANSVKMWNPNVNSKNSGNKKALSYSKFEKFTRLFY